MAKITGESNSIFSYAKNDPIHLNLFWGGFLLYALGFAASRTGHFSSTPCNLIQTGGLLLIFYASIFLIKFRIRSLYLKTLYILYIIWSIYVVSRGIHFDHTSNHEMLFDANYGIFIYFVPLIILFPNNLFFYRKMFEAIIVFGIAAIVFDAVFFRDMLNRSVETRDMIEYSAKLLSFPTGFILLTYIYHTKKVNFIAISIVFITILLAIYKARRGLMVIGGSVVIFAYIFYIFKTKNKLFAAYVTILMAILGIFYAGKFYKADKNGLLGLVAERGEEDTRTAVEVFFDSDMEPEDWAIGKGINGSYFCPDCEEDQESNYRSYIETGYLQIILKGGYIMLGLFLLIAFGAIILGIFFSNNILAKASGIWILISLLSLYPTTVNTFTLPFLLTWISIGTCYSKRIRQLSNEEITEFIQNPQQFRIEYNPMVNQYHE